MRRPRISGVGVVAMGLVAALCGWAGAQAPAPAERGAGPDAAAGPAKAGAAASNAPKPKAKPKRNSEIGQRQQASADVAAAMVRSCPPLAFIKRASYGLHGTNAVMFSQATGVGSEICVIDPARGTPEKTIFKTETGFIFNMNPSYDGRKLVFAYKTARNQPFHIWEINVDGTGLRQLTDGPYHDFSPVYYGDGRIIFSSSRVESYSLCQNYLACGLYAMRGDGSDLRRFDFTTLCTLTPAVLDDGSILCTRWEYQDKNIFAWQGLWSINPDGRQLKLFHGNTFRIPNAVYGGRPIPGTQRVMVVWVAHHHPPAGDLAVVDRERGLESPESMWKVTDVTPLQIDQALGSDWRKTGIGSQAADTYFPRAFVDPFPFSRELTVVSFGGDEPSRHNLVLLNHETGDTCLLHRSDLSCFSPVPLSRRAVPTVVPGDCPQEKGEGTFLVYDVYKGLLEQGVQRGQVKSLRIMSQSPKKYNTEGLRYNDHYPVVGQGSYYVKINHGEVPVDDNGAAYFRAPSNTEIYFIALDKDGREIQRMGSVTQITTGDLVSCVGCHEDRLTSPPAGSARPPRMDRPPDSITPPPWGAGPVDFVAQVQPVLDRHCVRCHTGSASPSKLDLTGDKTRFYNMAYESLVFGGYVDYYYINKGPNGVFPALSTGSWVSKLARHVQQSKLPMTDAERRVIYAWIDANVPYYGTWETCRPHTIGGRDAYARTKAGMGGAFASQEQGPQMSQYEPWVEAYQALASRLGLPRISYGGPNTFDDRGLINLTRPANSLVVLDNLAASAGGRAPDASAIFKSRSDPNYLALLGVLGQAKAALDQCPRIDMPGAKALPQERKFGRVFGAN